jgi:hypothetical protein
MPFWSTWAHIYIHFRIPKHIICSHILTWHGWKINRKSFSVSQLHSSLKDLMCYFYDWKFIHYLRNSLCFFLGWWRSETQCLWFCINGIKNWQGQWDYHLRTVEGQKKWAPHVNSKFGAQFCWPKKMAIISMIVYRQCHCLIDFFYHIIYFRLTPNVMELNLVVYAQRPRQCLVIRMHLLTKNQRYTWCKSLFIL